MRERIVGYGGGYPWWAWARRDSVARPPDLRERGSFHTWPRDTRLVRLELELPDAEVLLSDFAAWGCLLNGHIVADTEAEFDRWMALAEGDEGAAREAARATWERIFDLRRDAADPAWNGPGPAQDVQACFETLRSRDVRRATHYRARPTKEWLAAESSRATGAGERCTLATG